MEHMNKTHALPIWNRKNVEKMSESEIEPNEMSFHGVLKTYNIEVWPHEINLLSFMRSKQDEVDNIVELSTQLEAQKVQISAKFQLTKPTNDENVNNQPEKNQYLRTRKCCESTSQV